MDEKLSGYINSQPQSPPFINERHIVQELALRKKRLYIIMVSLAGLLWTLLLYTVAFMVGLENQTAGIALLTAISIGYICAGWFAGMVLKFRKVGF